MPEAANGYWSRPAEELLAQLASRDAGLSSEQARERLARYGPNQLASSNGVTRLSVLWNQLRSPLLLLLLFAAAISLLVGEWTDALIVLVIVALSVIIGYQREYRAQAAAALLRARIRTRVSLLRDGARVRVDVAQVVPGDVVLLAAGSLVPADALLLEATDCHVNQAVLTGESFPVEKRAGVLPVATPLVERSNCVYLGTNVRSGSARCLVIATGHATEFGAIAQRLALRPPETEFDRGIRRFGYLLSSAMLIMVLVVFVAHTLLGRAPLETLLFSIALAVGLSPELLPAILNVNLARGADAMAQAGVLVRRLSAIENLGSMDVLCTDKTGTLTAGVVELEGTYDAQARRDDEVLRLAALNAALQAGLPSPLDDAILSAHGAPPDAAKLAEIPFDFTRKRVSVVVAQPAGPLLIMKGAFQQVLAVCSALPDGSALDPAARAAASEQYEHWSRAGVRVLALATRVVAPQAAYGRQDERELTFRGFVTFGDRPKQGVREAIFELRELGVSVKLITGDHVLVARCVAEQVGLSTANVLTGAKLDQLQDEALWREAERTDIFAEVDPNQKERIILALKKMKHVVGFLGDGVNDAPAMHAADTSLSVEGAVDVAREAADFVLLERDLSVIRRGVEQGRHTFANTLKYVLTTTSANLGNMLSMAAASLYLPFLPLTAAQVLLNNLLSDIPALGVATDSVDAELVERPRRWDMRFIARFMVEFGALSSLIDLVTFAALLGLFHAATPMFRTGWFVASLLTELWIALVVRTRRAFFRSRPGTLLLVSTLVLSACALGLPFAPGAALLGFVPLSGALLAVLVGIALLYVLAAELMKRWFYRAIP